MAANRLSLVLVLTTVAWWAVQRAVADRIVMALANVSLSFVCLSIYLFVSLFVCLFVFLVTRWWSDNWRKIDSKCNIIKSNSVGQQKQQS